MTEKIEINRQTLYLTIDKVKVPTNKGIEEKENQFIAFFKKDKPTEIAFGEAIKNDKGSRVIFNSIEDARDYAIQRLEAIIYPPDFLHPLQYTKENLPEIMYKRLKFDIGEPNSDEIDKTIEGKIVECSLAANPPYLPGNAVLITENGASLELTFFEIKRIKELH